MPWTSSERLMYVQFTSCVQGVAKPMGSYINAKKYFHDSREDIGKHYFLYFNKETLNRAISTLIFAFKLCLRLTFRFSKYQFKIKFSEKALRRNSFVIHYLGKLLEDLFQVIKKTPE